MERFLVEPLGLQPLRHVPFQLPPLRVNNLEYEVEFLTCPVAHLSRVPLVIPDFLQGGPFPLDGLDQEATTDPIVQVRRVHDHL